MQGDGRVLTVGLFIIAGRENCVSASLFITYEYIIQQY